MIAGCPNCKARYTVDDAKVGPQGINLKCPKCQTVFKVTKDAAPAAPRPAAPAAPAAPRPPAPAAPRPPAPAAPVAPRPAAPAAPVAPRPAAPAAPRPAAPAAPVAPRPAAPAAPRPAAPAAPAAPRPAAPAAPAAPRPAAPAAPRPAAPPAPAAPRPAAPAAPRPAAPAAPAAPATKPLATGPYKPKTPSLGTVLVADSDDAFLKHIAKLLLQDSFTVYLAHDGAVAMELMKSKVPQAAIVDVGLPKIFGFEIAEMTKQDPALKDKVKIILLGSVYEKDRYRRQPQSFYGADEYIEKHHDGPVIMQKVRKLVLNEPEPTPPAPAEEVAPAPVSPAPPPAPAARPAPAPAPAAPAPAPRPAAPPAPGAAPTPDDPAHQKAARLARTIISDILLYNPEQVVRGIKEGNVYELLAKDIEDGSKHYNSRVAESIRAQRNYFKEAFEAMIAKKKGELGI